MTKNIRKLNQKIKRLTSNSVSDNDYNNNDYDKFYKYGYYGIKWGQRLEGQVSRRCRHVNRQINSKVGMTRW